MNLKNQKKLAASIKKDSRKRVKLDQSRLEDIKESITKADIKGLISEGAIVINKKRGTSKGRIRKKKEQKRKGRQKGVGSRKGKHTARLPRKEEWMNKIRKLRKFIKKLIEKDKITIKTKQSLYRKSSGGYFRNLRHLKMYIQENKLMKK